MGTIAMAVFLDSEFGTDVELPNAGSSLEHPLVFDSVAREFHALAEQGKVEILDQQVVVVGGESLIARMRFRRLR